MEQKDQDKKRELNAMMRRLGLLGMESPGQEDGTAPAAPKTEEEKTPKAAGTAPGAVDDLKEIIRNLEAVERQKSVVPEALATPRAQKPAPAQAPSVGPEDLSPMMDRLKRLDLSTFREEMKEKPEPAPAPGDDFSGLLKRLEGAVPLKEPVKETIRATRAEATPAPAPAQAPPAAPAAAPEDDLSALMKRLGGGLPPQEPGKRTVRATRAEATPSPAPVQAPPAVPAAAKEDDLSALMKRLEGIKTDIRAEPAPQAREPEAAPAPVRSPPPVPAPAPVGGEGDIATMMDRLKRLDLAIEEEKPETGEPARPLPASEEDVSLGPGEEYEALVQRLGSFRKQMKTARDARTAETATKEDVITATRITAREKEAVQGAPVTAENLDALARSATTAPAASATEQELTQVIDDIFKVHKDTPLGEADENVFDSLHAIAKGEAGQEEGEAARSKPVQAKRTRWSEMEAEEAEEAEDTIVSVDEIKDISDLILPKGATFTIDEVKLHERTAVFDVKGGGSSKVPSEMIESWHAQLPSGVIKDIVIGTDGAQKEKKGKMGAFLGKLNIMKVIRPEIEDYNPKIHGPLVDLNIRAQPTIEEVEIYPVNEPYAYIRIIHDSTTHEYTYQVLEPQLTPAEKELLTEIKQRLFETLEVNTKDITKDAAKKAIRGAVDTILRDYGISLTPAGREKVLYNIEKEFLGEGLIDPIMHDKYIEDISGDGVNIPIFVYHTSYENTKTSLMYRNADDLDSFVTKMAQRAGKHISIAEPILDATMPDGSRIQMTLGAEVTAHGSTFTIRKFREEPITPTDLIEWSTFSPLAVAYLWLAVESGKSAIFAGGTASGKTTTLNAISLFIPPMAKVVSLEDTRELKLPHPNWIASVTRDSFDTQGKGQIDMYELLRAALRQRPEYLVVGEVRGKEALTLFQAMSTGHVTYSTIHADSVASVVHRIENPPMSVPRNMLSALDMVCVQAQARIGGQRIRRSKQIIEILDIDPRTNELITNEVFRWIPSTDEIRYSGKSYILEEIMEERGWSESRMKEELKRRQELLEWMRLKMIRHYKDVAKMLISYFRDPEAVIEMVRKDLYTKGEAA
jgi:flagellar protein FlaI